jgi:hypothetical protein
MYLCWERDRPLRVADSDIFDNIMETARSDAEERKR